MFPDAFKLEAVAAVQGGRSVSQVAAELGLPDPLVRSWLRWAAGRGTAGSGAPAPPREQAAPARRVGRARPIRPPRSRGCGVNLLAARSRSPFPAGIRPGLAPQRPAVPRGYRTDRREAARLPKRVSEHLPVSEAH
ncbi:transposase [Roseicella aerolata]|uniref:Transposase n=1 Tax=Roseicella aerolata TaxID=2883479 RepID=A0A9X1IIK4_9PROT|nr:transposase [Roseicella aerolata]